MQIQVYFDGIRETIIERLATANRDVLVAAAWLTDLSLFDSLVLCQRRGVNVSIAMLDDRINRRASIAWERLSALGGEIFWIPERTDRAGSLHHKFCLIDTNTIINGSFNWTYRASRADENIIVIQGDAALAAQFRLAFQRLLNKHGHLPVPTSAERKRLMARLTVIDKLLKFEKFDDLPEHCEKLTRVSVRPEIEALILKLKGRDWDGARAHITDLLVHASAMTSYQDPRINELRWQVSFMETQVLALELELVERKRQIHLFDYQQDKSIGELVRRYLDIKRRYLWQLMKQEPSDEAREEAETIEDSFRRYEESLAAPAGQSSPVQLDLQQQTELKQLYRKLSMYCHPDRVRDEDKVRAQVLFQQMQIAYHNNNLGDLRRLKENIEKGHWLPEEGLALNPTERLQERLIELHTMFIRLSQELSSINQSKTWQTLSSQTDWGAWFAQQAERLQAETTRYQTAMNGWHQEQDLM